MSRRRAMTPARKARIHERAGGVCWVCALPVPVDGPEVEYDHRLHHWMSDDDSDANIFPIHAACHKPKTAEDAKIRAKIKRLIKREAGEKKKTTIRRQGFRAAHRAIPSRPFPKRKS